MSKRKQELIKKTREPAGRSIWIEDREYPLEFTFREGKWGGVWGDIPWPEGYPETPLRKKVQNIGYMYVTPDGARDSGEEGLLYKDFGINTSKHGPYADLVTEEEVKGTKDVGKALVGRVTEMNLKHGIVERDGRIVGFADGFKANQPLLFQDRDEALKYLKGFPKTEENYNHEVEGGNDPDPRTFASEVKNNMQLVDAYKKRGWEVSNASDGRRVTVHSTPEKLLAAHAGEHHTSQRRVRARRCSSWVKSASRRCLNPARANSKKCARHGRY
eukprot:jgi/Mesvir1/23024/Mv19881-RA.1